MSKTDYQLQLRGYVGGYDFDRSYVDYVLAQHKDKHVDVLIDSLGGSLATALSIASAFRWPSGKTHQRNFKLIGAGNNDGFIKFLGGLRNMYLDRESHPTFQSVILAGVYDIKNLKLKMRPDEQHQYNSPWNVCANESRATSSLDGYAECSQTSPYGSIAVPFDVDMSLSAEGIAGMLDDYEADHHTGMNTAEVASWIREYTSGYPFLVSRLCQLMDDRDDWSQEGFRNAVKALLNKRNSLFDDIPRFLLLQQRQDSVLAATC